MCAPEADNMSFFNFSIFFFSKSLSLENRRTRPSSDLKNGPQLRNRNALCFVVITMSFVT